ncbi:MAG TPA: transposase [Thermodesulfovibrionales bacterium]|nr:transposase [Thermodesulfovibrionales bacterium]
MPRIARAVAPGFPHHVVQRGNNRGDIFFSDEDRAVYLFLLKTYSEKWGSAILSYCLMPNHVHLLVRPSSESSLQKTMQGVTLCYTQHINRKYRRTGRLWESRYHSCIIDQEAYLWAVARYVEQNPVRAAIVRNPQDYRYSSAPAQFGLVLDPVLSEDLFPEIQREEYVDFIQQPVISQAEMKKIRRSVRTGRPLGDARFVEEIEQRLGKRLTPLAHGRPRKKHP